MGMIKEGMTAPNFVFQTPWKENIKLMDVAKSNKKIVLMFLRYFGCTLCQVDIRNLVSNYDVFKNNDTEVLVVLQTNPPLIKDHVRQDEMPLTLVCDPEQEFFQLYGVVAAKSEEELKSKEMLAKVNAARKEGVVNLGNNVEHNELQLPAAFVINNDGVVEFSHYGKHGADIPSIKQLEKLTAVSCVKNK